MAQIMLITFHRGFLVDYVRHIDHAVNTVSYLTDQNGLKLAVPRQHAAQVAIADPQDVESVCRAAASLIERTGPPEVVCAPSEYDLTLAATVRRRFSIPGLTEEQTLRCQDKVLMKRALRAQRVATPAFVECYSRQAVRALIKEVGFPIVLKPRRGAASKGVTIVRNNRQLSHAWSQLVPDQYECEEFVPGPIYHVDGLVQGGAIRFSLVSKYINTCLQSAQGLPHGSVVVDDRSLSCLLTEFTKTSLRAVRLGDSVFHMEIIMKAGKVSVFLEIGARPGGAEVQQLVEDIYGVDLLRDWVVLQLGAIPKRCSIRSAVGGWLVVPAPCEPPYEVISATPMSGQIPYLYHERIPVPGDIHDATTFQQDRWPGGRFRYAGPSSLLVERDIRNTIKKYQIKAAPVPHERARLVQSSLATSITW